MENFKKLFPVRNNYHEMDKRKAEKFHVKYAKTERYKKSAIPAMQRALKKEESKLRKLLSRSYFHIFIFFLYKHCLKLRSILKEVSILY